MKSEAHDLWFEPHETAGGLMYRELTYPERPIAGYVSLSGRTVSTPWSTEHYPVGVHLVRRDGMDFPIPRPIAALESMLWMFLAGCVGLGVMFLAMYLDGQPIWRR